MTSAVEGGKTNADGRGGRGRPGSSVASAIEGGGNAIADFECCFSGSSPTRVKTAFKPASGGWQAPVNLSTVEAAGAPAVAANAQGQAAAAWEAGRAFSPQVVQASVTQSPVLQAEYSNWALAGSITDKKQREPITLPAGSTFNGHGEVNAETGAGSVTGSLSIPPFTTAIRLFGALSLRLGMTISEAGALEGTLAKSEAIPGDESLTIPLKLNFGVTSLSLLGLALPASCATHESASLVLADTLTAEEFLSRGWSFTGTTTLPRFNCEGAFGGLLGFVLSALSSGPENPYAITLKAP